MVAIGDFFRAGSRVRVSGIYRVTHGTGHVEPHYVTCVFGETFPACRHCGNASFELVRDATHAMRDEQFASAEDLIGGSYAPPPVLSDRYEPLVVSSPGVGVPLRQ